MGDQMPSSTSYRWKADGVWDNYCPEEEEEEEEDYFAPEDVLCIRKRDMPMLIRVIKKQEKDKTEEVSKLMSIIETERKEKKEAIEQRAFVIALVMTVLLCAYATHYVMDEHMNKTDYEILGNSHRLTQAAVAYANFYHRALASNHVFVYSKIIGFGVSVGLGFTKCPGEPDYNEWIQCSQGCSLATAWVTDWSCLTETLRTNSSATAGDNHMLLNKLCKGFEWMENKEQKIENNLWQWLKTSYIVLIKRHSVIHNKDFEHSLRNYLFCVMLLLGLALWLYLMFQLFSVNNLSIHWKLLQCIAFVMVCALNQGLFIMGAVLFVIIPHTETVSDIKHKVACFLLSAFLSLFLFTPVLQSLATSMCGEEQFMEYYNHNFYAQGQIIPNGVLLENRAKQILLVMFCATPTVLLIVYAFIRSAVKFLLL